MPAGALLGRRLPLSRPPSGQLAPARGAGDRRGERDGLFVHTRVTAIPARSPGLAVSPDVAVAYDFAQERLLHALIDALESHQVEPNVGLLLPATFPQHRGGVGIIVCCNGERPKVAALLEAMGCMTREHELGIEGHLRNGTELGPAPVPVVHVSSADGCTAAEDGLRAKKCNGPCGEVKPVSEFSPNGSGKLMPACRPCDAARQKVQRLARAAARVDTGP